MSNSTLTITIGSDPSGLIYASSNSNIYTSQGYDYSGNIGFTYDTISVSINNNNTKNVYTSSVDSSYNLSGLTNLFSDSNGNSSTFKYSSYNGGNNPVQIHGSYNDTVFGQQLMYQEPSNISTLYTFTDVNNKNYGTVTYDPSYNSFTASSSDDSFNYQNLSFIANCELCNNLYQNITNPN